MNSDFSWHLSDVLRNFNMFSGPWGDLRPFLDDKKSLYLRKSEAFWKSLAKEILLQPSVVLYVKPSKREMERWVCPRYRSVQEGANYFQR